MPLTPADVKALDRNAEALGVPVSLLMENAGAAVAREIQARWPEGTVLVLAGTGNNGGDGCVVARLLHVSGRSVHLVLVGAGMRGDVAQDALDSAEEAGVRIVPYSEPNLVDLLEEADLVVDAMLGVGIHGALRPPYDRIVSMLDEHEVPVVAVDVPTGHGGDTCLDATLTVTFHDRKTEMVEARCGDIVVVDIGIPKEATTHVGPGDLVARFPRSQATGRKGDHGRILIIGGGPYTGAPCLTALGCMLTGIDRIFLSLPQPAAEVARANLLEAVVDSLPGRRLGVEHLDPIAKRLDDVDVIVMGPGLGDAHETIEAVREVCLLAKERGIGLVLDADALRWRKNEELRKLGALVTPHAGEFKRISGVEVPADDLAARVAVVREWIGDTDSTVLLKGPTDLIVTKDRVAFNTTHHEVMTTGGTGDVLCGIVGALYARGCDPFDAARLATFLNGSAGLFAYEEQSYGVRASDVAMRIPHVLAEHLS